MIRFFLTGGAVLMTSLSVMAATAQNKTDSNKTKQAKEPDGFIFVEEDVSVDTHALPRLFMDDAKSDLANRNYGEAASDLRAASRVYQAESRGLKMAEGRSELREAEQRLDDLASDVRAGKVTSEKSLSSQLAQILSMSASSDRQLANAHWARSEYKAAGYDLRRAAQEIEDAAKWTGKTIDRESLTAVDDLRSVGNKLIDGGHWTSTEVHTALNELGSTARRMTVQLDGTGDTVSGTSSAPSK